ncbi:MAG TPA: glycosyltransferase family 4 protein [Gemmatimonadales bacterium]|nr:glycosyltransferase family 4 protein [Gemmatimonadales bacterium]
MRALVLAPQPFFSPRGTPFSVYYRTEVMAQLGVSVDLLTYGTGQDVDLPGVRIIRLPRVPGMGEVRIGPSLRKLVLDVLMCFWTVALLLRHRYDFVHAHEESVFWARALKPLFGFKLVYDMHSSLPQQLTNFRFTTSRLLIGLFRRLEAAALAASDAVITICPDLAGYAVTQVRDPARHFLIENSIFDDVKLKGAPKPAPRDRPARRASGAVRTSGAIRLSELPPSRPLVVYAGTFETYQGIELLLRAFALVQARRPEAFLLLVGGRPEQVTRYEALAGQLGLAGHCWFTGRVEQALAKHYIAAAAVLTSPRTDGTNTPLKIYEQLASGVPLVATRIGSHTQVLDERVCELVAPTPEEVARGILTLLDDPGRRAEVVQAALALYAERYARPIYEAKMRQLLAVLA